MFIIDLRNKQVSDSRFSVIGNNNVDTVHIFSHFTQYVDYNVYLKVVSSDKTYADKIAIASENIEIVDDALVVKWTMGEISTQCKKIDIQLQFENNDGTLIAQSRIFTIILGDTIDVSEEISHIYPDVLREMQDEINELKNRRPFISGINQVGNPTQLVAYQDEVASSYGAYVRFILTASELQRVKNAKFVVFTMNNGFVMTPLAQLGATRSLGNFVYRSDGTSKVAKVKIEAYHDEEGNVDVCDVTFDEDYAHAVFFNEYFPYAMLLIAE